MENKKIKIIFIGTPEFGANILEELIKENFEPSLVITTPDKPVGRKKEITSPPVKVLAKKYKIKILQPERIMECLNEIEEIKPDLIVVAAYRELIPQKILDIPKKGSLNVHPSLLPKYRGSSPIQTSILRGEKETGVSIILMDEKMDHGKIVSNVKYKISSDNNHEKLSEELSDLAAKLLIKTIPNWMKGKIKPTPQNDSQATYTKRLKREDGKIDWGNSAEEIERKIRAFYPWPGTFTEAKIKENSEKKKIKILKVEIMKQTKICPSGPNGKTFLAPNDKIAVQTGKDFLIVEGFQIEGKKPTTSKDFLKGNSDFIGTILD